MTTIISAHGCSLCENRFDLNAQCCCKLQQGDLKAVFDVKLLRRGSLYHGDTLCPMHYMKLSTGMLFGCSGGRYACCSPFHVKEKKRTTLKRIPHNWQILFDKSNHSTRYCTAKYLCWNCYKITLDILNSKLRNSTEDEVFENFDFNEIDLSPFLNNYTSPSQYLSSENLNFVSPSWNRFGDKRKPRYLSQADLSRRRLDYVTSNEKYGGSTPSVFSSKSLTLPATSNTNSFGLLVDYTSENNKTARSNSPTSEFSLEPANFNESLPNDRESIMSADSGIYDSFAPFPNDNITLQTESESLTQPSLTAKNQLQTSATIQPPTELNKKIDSSFPLTDIAVAIQTAPTVASESNPSRTYTTTMVDTNLKSSLSDEIVTVKNHRKVLETSFETPADAIRSPDSKHIVGSKETTNETTKSAINKPYSALTSSDNIDVAFMAQKHTANYNADLFRKRQREDFASSGRANGCIVLKKPPTCQIHNEEISPYSCNNNYTLIIFGWAVVFAFYILPLCA